jgi:hypothetical protein
MNQCYHRPQDEQTALRDAATMPSLTHYHPGRSFDIQESQVCDWLCSRAPIRQWLFNFCKRHGAIEFDLETYCWRGAATVGNQAREHIDALTKQSESAPARK